MVAALDPRYAGAQARANARSTRESPTRARRSLFRTAPSGRVSRASSSSSTATARSRAGDASRHRWAVTPGLQ